jgi:signal transduction histidine kinase
MLLPVIVMTLFVVASLTILFARAHTDMILKQEAEVNAAGFDAVTHTITTMVNTSVQETRGMMTDERVAAYANLRFASEAERIRARIACRNYLRAETARHDGIYGLLFMREDGSLFGTLPERNYFYDDPEENPLPEAVRTRVRELGPGQTAWIGPVNGKDLYGFEDQKTPGTVMIAAWKSVDVSYGECRVMMLMDESVFAGLFGPLQDGKSIWHLFTEDGTEFFHTGTGGWLKPDRLLSESNSGRVIRDEADHPVCAFSTAMVSPPWTLVREVSMEQNEELIRRVQRSALVLAAVVFLIALVFYLIWLRRRFLREFDELMNGIVRMGRGELEPAALSSSSIDEFDSMQREINRTGLALNRQMDTIRRMEREQLEQEMRNLQTILTPHIILNSVTAIKWMATMMGADNVSDMLTELSEMLRPILREWRVEWTIREELEHLSHYTKLLDLRYGNNFRLICEIPGELYETTLPRFTLQPLIENACEHGSRKGEALTVTLRGEAENDRIRITVENNGRSITEKELAEIRESLRSGERGQHIGLYNVYNRLILCKGPDSTLEVEAVLDGGTRVVLEWLVASD